MHSRCVWAAVCLMVGVAPVSAQRGSLQAAGLQVASYSFETDHAGGFSMEGAMPGLVYTSRGVLVTASRTSGRAEVAGVDSKLTLSDVSMRFRSDPPWLTRSLGRGMSVSIPLLLLSSYRMVEARQGPVTIQVFDYSAIGIGSGVGVRGDSRRVQWEARLTPAIGFATRGFGGSTGRFTALEGDVGVFIGRLLGRFGLSAGYAWAVQNWHVGGPDAVVLSSAGKVDYHGSAHTFRLGMAW